MPSDKTYTSIDFQRYHAGTMSAAEMHKLEKAALDDPFLADALEGYAYTTSFDKDVLEIKERLYEKKKNKKINADSFTQKAWWRIAAMLVLIAGAGIVFYKINYNNKQNDIVKKEIPNVTESADSAAVQDNNLTAKNTDTAKENTLAFETQKSNPKVTYKKKDKTSGTSELSSPAVKEYTFNNKSEALKKANAFSAPPGTPDSARVSSAPVNDQHADEVVTSGYATARKKDVAGSISRFEKEDKTTPFDNDDAFNQYLTDSTQQVFDSSGKQATGEVVLSFMLSRKGRPQGISIVQSTCKACEGQAIHLLQNGPKWKRENKKIKRVYIKF